MRGSTALSYVNRILACLLLLMVGAASAHAESMEMRIVTKIRLTDCCIEYQGLITSEANEGVFELYEEASPKPSTLLIESYGGAAGAAMHLANWMLDNELDVQVKSHCYSSCANYVFLAGRNKLLDPHASLMWHGGVTQRIDRADLEHLLDDMLGALEEDARNAVLAERSRERLLELLEASRLEMIARETRFFERIRVDQRITVLGQLFEHELLANDHDYTGWDLSLADLRKLGVHGIQVIGDEPWTPQSARDDLLVYRIRLDQLPGFEPRVP
jgi:ATP-dependent protease ClpP protease subunit